MADLIDVIKSRDVLYKYVGRDAAMIKVAAADKVRFLSHIANIRLFRNAPSEERSFELEAFMGMKVRYLEEMKPGQVAFADKDGNVIGFATIPLDDPPGEPPKGLLRKP